MLNGIEVLAGPASPLVAVLVIPDPDSSLGRHSFLLLGLGWLSFRLLLSLGPEQLSAVGVAFVGSRHLLYLIEQSDAEPYKAPQGQTKPHPPTLDSLSAGGPAGKLHSTIDQSKSGRHFSLRHRVPEIQL